MAGVDDVWGASAASLSAGAVAAAVAPPRRSRPLRVAAARNDDAAALEALYEEHHQALYRYSRSIVHSETDAWDVLQSTMLKALAALQRGERVMASRPWLFRIAHNEAISLLRTRRPTIEFETVEESLGRDALHEDMLDRVRLAQLYSDLRDLPERQRAALILRELNGLGHDEVAAVLECSSMAAKQSIFEARKALHGCAEGRAMACEEVMRMLSDGDRRVLRSRRLRAHVRDCASCRRFQADIGRRPADLALIAPPLPLAASAALLGHLLPGAKLSAAASGSAGAGGAAASTVGTAGALSAAKVAIVAAFIGAATLGGTLVASHPFGHRSPPAWQQAPPSTRTVQGARELSGSAVSSSRSAVSAGGGLLTAHALYGSASGQPSVATGTQQLRTVPGASATHAHAAGKGAVAYASSGAAKHAPNGAAQHASHGAASHGSNGAAKHASHGAAFRGSNGASSHASHGAAFHGPNGAAKNASDGAAFHGSNGAAENASYGAAFHRSNGAAQHASNSAAEHVSSRAGDAAAISGQPSSQAAQSSSKQRPPKGQPAAVTGLSQTTAATTPSTAATTPSTATTPNSAAATANPATTPASAVATTPTGATTPQHGSAHAAPASATHPASK